MSLAEVSPDASEEQYHLWHPFTQMQKVLNAQNIVVERGEGPYLFDQNDKRYLNLTSCLWNAPLGLGRSEIIDAITEQLNELSFAALFRTAHRPAIKLAQRLSEIAPGRLNRVFLTSNGSESVESAIKMVRQYFHHTGSKKYKVISLLNAYHGVSYGALAASGFAEDQQGFGPMPEGFLKIPAPFNRDRQSEEERAAFEVACAKELERTILAEGADSVAMFLIEPVQGMGGAIAPGQAYFDVISETCRRYDVKLVVDEVTTGFGRTGTLFASERFNLDPDVMCLGKAISGGYFPLGAAVATDEIWDVFLSDSDGTRFNHGSTNAGHPGACAAGLAAIDILTRDNLIEAAAERGATFLSDLRQLKELQVVDDVRGIGMLFAIDLVRDEAGREPLDAAAMDMVAKACYARGLWIHFSGNRILLLPPFILGDEHFAEAFAGLKRILSRVPAWI
ncbi:aspartate aminotransferase family protein [Hoeflea prorocentri]|uniref:Aspartate aminotransferase family protein n=1 Tax=Hoeflea prorocentri TaxID=1922333 RepID=A0A9X3ZGK3_9HYPH|nr:aspartate aminotransferase family protein [Hoeflea prorocentri]MCY6379830.1 aspartate aminotransferase family protein [Hoeflea prorocentri]MDA5397630.1 aspartate aminotransferase family protein [Hoeflea prorocentri]